MVVFLLLMCWTGPVDLPYAEAGLSEREAAAHLLSRLTYGARPGDVDAVVAMDLETWLNQQLAADQASPKLDAALDQMPDLTLSTAEIVAKYPDPGRLIRQMQREGKLDEDDPETTRRQVRQQMRSMGYSSQRQLVGQLRAQKLFRAVYDENQLREILTDFWFNHFNVSTTNNRARVYVTTYERDAIRPHVLGDFRTMLGATATHPAMLLYLDNALSTAAEGVRTTVSVDRYSRGRFGNRRGNRAGQRQGRNNPLLARNGLNENYARELLELHTLGVDGGYTQDDVVAVARAFTGWTIYPHQDQHGNLRRVIDRMPGFERHGDFLFRANAHDAEAKTILGQSFPQGGGLNEGQQILDLLSRHPSTARLIATKFARRFHSDQPPQALIERLAQSFQSTGGNLKSLLTTLVSSPEFWSEDARANKVKTPLELAASAIRALDADITRPRGLNQWLEKMGQPLYGYAAPTGFPDEGSFWINTGLLVNRVNFVRDLASGRVEGVRLNVDRLRQWQELDYPITALTTQLLPGRDTTALIQALKAPPADEPATPSQQTQSMEPADAGPMATRDSTSLAEELVASYGMDVSGMDVSGMDASGMDASVDDESAVHVNMAVVHHDILKLVGNILASPDFQRR